MISPKLFNLLEKYPLPVPVAAKINRIYLGGELELVLACQIRLYSAEYKSHLCLPEVQLCLIPGSGGIQCLPRSIGLINGLD